MHVTKKLIVAGKLRVYKNLSLLRMVPLPPQPQSSNKGIARKSKRISFIWRAMIGRRYLTVLQATSMSPRGYKVKSRAEEALTSTETSSCSNQNPQRLEHGKKMAEMFFTWTEW
jgi:hypothetical protein